MNKDIVLIPGALATPKLWQHQENYFQNKLNCQYVDVLGSQSISDMANRFAKFAPDKFTLIGFSMGGYIALEMFNHFAHKIEKLILINSAAKIISEKGQIERERSLALINKGKFDFLISLIFKNSIHGTYKHDSLLPIAQEMANEVGADNYVKQLNAILNKPDHSALLSKITCPTLLLASKQDNIMPNERSEHLAEHIKNSELIYIEDCGHLATLEQPEMVNQILENWLL